MSFIDNIKFVSTIEFETNNRLASAAQYLMTPCRAAYGRKFVLLEKEYDKPLSQFGLKSHNQSPRFQIDITATDPRNKWVQKALEVAAFVPAVIGVAILTLCQNFDIDFANRFRLAKEALIRYQDFFDVTEPSSFVCGYRQLFTRQQRVEMIEKRIRELIPNLENPTEFMLKLIAELQCESVFYSLFASDEEMYSIVLNAIDQLGDNQKKQFVEKFRHTIIIHWIGFGAGYIPKIWEYKILQHLNFENVDVLERYEDILIESDPIFQRLNTLNPQFNFLIELTTEQKRVVYAEMSVNIFNQLIERHPFLLIKDFAVLSEAKKMRIASLNVLPERSKDDLENLDQGQRKEIYQLMNNQLFKCLTLSYPCLLIADFDVLTKQRQKSLAKNLNVKDRVREYLIVQPPALALKESVKEKKYIDLLPALKKLDLDTYTKFCNRLGNGRFIKLAISYGNDIIREDYQFIKNFLSGLNREQLLYIFSTNDSCNNFFKSNRTPQALCAWNILFTDPAVASKLSGDDLLKLVKGQVDPSMCIDGKIVNNIPPVDSLPYASLDVLRGYFDELKQKLVEKFKEEYTCLKEIHDEIQVEFTAEIDKFFSTESLMDFIETAKQHPKLWKRDREEDQQARLSLEADNPINKFNFLPSNLKNLRIFKQIRGIENFNNAARLYLQDYLDLFAYSLLSDLDLFVKVYRHVLTAEERFLAETVLRDWVGLSGMFKNPEQQYQILEAGLIDARKPENLFDKCFSEILKKPNCLTELQDVPEPMVTRMVPFLEREIVRRQKNLVCDKETVATLESYLQNLKEQMNKTLEVILRGKAANERC